MAMAEGKRHVMCMYEINNEYIQPIKKEKEEASELAH